jgi:hypothetical protein
LRLHPLLGLLLIVATQCAPTSPPPETTPAPVIAPPTDALLLTCDYRYWHVAPHARWQYHVTSKGTSYPHPTGEMNFNRTEEIVGVTPGEFRVAFTSSDSSETPWIKIFRCGQSGPGELPNEVERANGSLMSGIFVPARLESGTEWENVYATGPTTSTTKFHADGAERVTVPAGTYDAVRVSYVRTDRSASAVSMTVEGTLWFAAGVGVVREEFRQKTMIGNTTAEGQTMEELIAFDAGH